MADRDALIVICWLVILILVFFECFHRKLKARFSGDIRPPPNTRESSTSFPSDARLSSIPGSHFGGNFRRDLLPPTIGHSMSSNRGARFTGPIAITTSTSTAIPAGNKEVCRIPMMSMMMSYADVEDEEPPPTYEEAIIYAKLMSKFQSSSSANLERAEESVSNDVSCNIVEVNNSNSTNPIISTTSVNKTTTTAIFVSEEESDDDEDADYDSSSSQSANDSDEDEQSELDVDSNNNNDNLACVENGRQTNAKLTSRSVNGDGNEQCSGEVQCNMNVILTSSSSTSKNLDRIEIEYNEKIKITRENKKCEKNNLEYASTPPSPPPKLLPPPPGNISENFV